MSKSDTNLYMKYCMYCIRGVSVVSHLRSLNEAACGESPICTASKLLTFGIVLGDSPFYVFSHLYIVRHLIYTALFLEMFLSLNSDVPLILSLFLHNNFVFNGFFHGPYSLTFCARKPDWISKNSCITRVCWNNVSGYIRR